MSLDNRASQKPTTEEVTITRRIEASAEFHCITCTTRFWVYGGPLGLQTLFCGPCMTALKNSIIREKTENYGW